MTESQLFSIGVSLILLIACALILVYNIGEFQAFWERINRERRWQKWKRKNLRI